ncbi:MAG: hypothetical protein AB7E85_02505 [Pseudobdellovibrionaceae bacterium]
METIQDHADQAREALERGHATSFLRITYHHWREAGARAAFTESVRAAAQNLATRGETQRLAALYTTVSAAPPWARAVKEGVAAAAAAHPLPLAA